MDYKHFIRRPLALTALTACVVLAGCDAERAALVTNSKANKPIPQKLINEIAAKEMDPLSPILIRLFKQEAELEIWKQDKTGRFALLQTYPICRWSGELGPKIKENDRQAPEGFYNVTPTQMNPESQYHLSFNLGYPNSYDRSLGRTGAHLMVHGDCSSSGCYAMTDEYVSEIYALGRESFFGGQRSFQVQAYPFRMTAQNMAKHRGNPNLAFWKMLKQGNDHFEVTQLEPKVDVCEQRYVFNGEKDPNSTSTRPLAFNPIGKCPAYHVQDDIAEAVAEKERKDEYETAELIKRGTPSVAMRRGIDGGMHPLFAAKTPNGNTGLSDTKSYSLASYATVPPVPPSVNPPASPDGPTAMVTAQPTPGGEFLSSPIPATTRAEPAKQQLPAPVRVASASSSSDGFFANLVRKIGFGGSDNTASTTASAKQAAPPPVKQKAPVVAAAKSSAPVRSAESKRAPKPEPKEPDALLAATPIVPTNSFDSRWLLR